MPRINEKLPEKVKNYPEKKLPEIKKFLPRKENVPNTAAQPLRLHEIYYMICILTLTQYLIRPSLASNEVGRWSGSG